jgi:hypothetical protein
MAGIFSPSTPTSASNTLSVYEQERQKNIEKNKAVLAELGLGDARRQLIETHKKDVVEKIKRRYTKKSFAVDTPRRSARIQGKPVRYSDGFGSEDGEDEGKVNGSPNTSIVSYTGGGSPKRKYSYYEYEEEHGSRPKYKNELTTCHFCRKRDRKPKTRCSACGIKYWVGDCCRSCFEQHFEEEDFDEVMLDKNWVCYCCRKKCPCLECIAGITKGRRYGPRKDAQKEEICAPVPFTGVVPEQYGLFPALPLPSFLSYNNSQTSSGMPQFTFPMLPAPPTQFPPPSPPHTPAPLASSSTSSSTSPPSPTSSPSVPAFSSHTSFAPYPTSGLFAPPSYASFPALQNPFGPGPGGLGGVSPQNMFGISPLSAISLPPPHPSQPAHPYLPSTSFLGSPRDAESLGNGAVCGYKMAQVIAQITNAPSGYGSFLPPQTSFNSNFNNGYANCYNSGFLNNNSYSNMLNTPLIPSVHPKKRGRKPKGFNFALHASESVSSDPMSSNDGFEEQPLDILPPIKIPKRRGRKPKRDLPALSVEEEAISMGMTNPEENIDDSFGSGGDPPTPVLSPPCSPVPEKKKRGRPKSSDLQKQASTKVGGRDVLPKKRGRKPKVLPNLGSPLLSPSSELSGASPSQTTPFDMNGDDEFFSTGGDILDYDDDKIFNEIDDFVMPPFRASATPLGDDIGSPALSPPTPTLDDEPLKLRLKASSSHLPMLQKKRGRKPKKNNKVKLPRGMTDGAEKRKYTKRKSARDAEDTTNLRRSARPPQASRAFDDHYLL